MENFELIDNLFQITVLLCACVAAGILAIRHRNRSFLILSLAYRKELSGESSISQLTIR